MKKILVISICFFVLSWLPQPIQHENSSFYSAAYLKFCHKYNIGPSRAHAFVLTGLVLGGAVTYKMLATSALVGGALYYTTQVANDPDNPFNTRDLWQSLSNFKLNGQSISELPSAVPVEKDFEDVLSENGGSPPEWVEAEGVTYYLHRSQTITTGTPRYTHRDSSSYVIYVLHAGTEYTYDQYKYQAGNPPEGVDVTDVMQDFEDLLPLLQNDIKSQVEAGASVTADASTPTANKPADASEDNTVEGPTIAGINENGEYVDEEGKVIPAEQLPQSVKDGQYDDVLPVMPSQGVADIEAKTEDGGVVPLPEAIEALLKAAGLTAGSTITAVDGKTVYWKDAQGNVKRTVVSDQLAQELASSGTVAQDVPGTEPGESETPEYDIDPGNPISTAAPQFDTSIEVPEKAEMDSFVDSIFNNIPVIGIFDDSEVESINSNSKFVVDYTLPMTQKEVHAEFDFADYASTFEWMGTFLYAVTCILAYKKALVA